MSDEQAINDTNYSPTVVSEMEVWYIILGIPTILCAFGGNLGTIIAFYTVPSLNAKPSDLIILNLAFADLGMSVFTIPIFQVMVGAYGYWPWGELPCRILLSIAMVLIFAGVLFIILMSWDRFLMLGLDYPDYLKRQSERRVKIVILVTWLAATSQGLYEVAFWNVIIASTPLKYRTDFNRECDCPSMKALTATMFCALIFSIFPFVSIALLGALIVAKLRQLLMHWRRVGYDGSAGTSTSASTNVTSVNAITEARANSHFVTDRPPSSNEDRGDSGGKGNATDEATMDGIKQHTVTKNPTKCIKEPASRSVTSTLGRPIAGNPMENATKARAIRKRYIKPVLTYVVLVLSLAGCTLPLYVYILYVNISCPDCYDYFTAGYFFGILVFNSALNPLLYALTNVKIRAFYVKKYHSMRRWIFG